MNTWEPPDEAAWVDLTNNLDIHLHDYDGTLGDLTNDILQMHKFNLGCKFVVQSSNDANSAADEMSKYKIAFFNGPSSTDMTHVPHAAFYAPSPASLEVNLKDFIRKLRARLMECAGWTDAIGVALHLTGSADPFNPLTYKPKFKVVSTVGNILVMVSGIKNLQGHNVYIRAVGDTTWERKIFFGGADVNIERVSVPVTEALEMQLRGVIKNVEIGVFSNIVPFSYQNLPPVKP